jgi:hypothetical protein
MGLIDDKKVIFCLHCGRRRKDFKDYFHTHAYTCKHEVQHTCRACYEKSIEAIRNGEPYGCTKCGRTTEYT